MTFTLSVCWGELFCTKRVGFALQTSSGQNCECGRMVWVNNTTAGPRGTSSGWGASLERLWLGQARSTCANCSNNNWECPGYLLDVWSPRGMVFLRSQCWDQCRGTSLSAAWMLGLGTASAVFLTRPSYVGMLTCWREEMSPSGTLTGLEGGPMSTLWSSAWPGAGSCRGVRQHLQAGKKMDWKQLLEKILGSVAWQEA